MGDTPYTVTERHQNGWYLVIRRADNVTVHRNPSRTQALLWAMEANATERRGDDGTDPFEGLA